MLRIARSEWIKLRTTKSLWWTSALVIVFSLGFTLLMGLLTGSTLANTDPAKEPDIYSAMMNSLKNSSALSGFLIFGLMVILIQGVLTVTSDYGSNTSKTTLLASPKRWPVPVAKFLVYGLIAAVIALVSMAGSMMVYKWTLGTKIDDAAMLTNVGLGADSAWTMIGRGVLYAVLAVAVAIGVGYLVRHTAGGISLILLWVLVIEQTLVQLLPKVRDYLPPYMPFKNMENATLMMDTPDAPWGQVGSIAYFAGIAAVIFIAGVVALQKRDA